MNHDHSSPLSNNALATYYRWSRSSNQGQTDHFTALGVSIITNTTRPPGILHTARPLKPQPSKVRYTDFQSRPPWGR